MAEENCPCGSGRAYDACCGPLLAGERPAATAEALMRSRYTAFVRGAIDHVVATTVTAQRKDLDVDALRHWSEHADWQGFEILAQEGGGPGDETAAIEFVARYHEHGQEVRHHERAIFVRESGHWRFDPRHSGPPPLPKAGPPVGRNDPCPCNSGRKYKKCCGAAA